MRELLARIDSAELTEWIAYSTLEPFGPLNDDVRAGKVCSAIGNWAGKSLKEGAEPLSPLDFFPSLGERGREADDAPILLPDPEAQSKLLMAAIFKKTD